ncbi:MAG: tautomerase family protein [Proteobacteria bacterium]|nr:tautomerase family protein [Pseudomonadota bacterium]MBS0609105.1 tautomerase family protein [Pseudomonadota bacterium]
MLIEITLLAGRTDAQKHALFEEATAAASVSLGMDPAEVPASCPFSE